MKHVIRWVAAVVVLSATAAAAELLLSLRDNTVATNATVIFPGERSRQPVLQYLDVTGNNAASTVQLLGGRVVTRLSSVTAWDEAGLEVDSTNGFGVGDGLVILQRPDGVCSAHFFDHVDPGVITITPIAGVAVPVGSQVWWASGVATNLIGNATVRLDGPLWSAQGGAPLAVRFYGPQGSDQKINAASVEYR